MLFKQLSEQDLSQLQNSFNEDIYAIFYHNVDNSEFYAGALGSEDRLARNLNVISFFTINEFKNIFANILLSEFNSSNTELKDLTLQEKFLYFLVSYHEENIKIPSDFNVYDSNEEKINQLLIDVLKKDHIFNSLNNNISNMILSIIPENYYVYIDKTYDNKDLLKYKLLLYITHIMNCGFSLHALAMNTDIKYQLHAVKLNYDQLVQLFALYIPNFENDLVNANENSKFPTYEIWKKLEIEFYNNVKNDIITFEEFTDKYFHNTNNVNNDSIPDLSNLLGI